MSRRSTCSTSRTPRDWLAKLAKTDEVAAAHISEYRRIIAFRNILIHGYAEVDYRLVWEVVSSKVPVLADEVARLLGND